MVTYYKKLQPIKSHKPLNTWFVRSRDELKKIISTTTMPMATKPDRVVTYNKELNFIKSRFFYCVISLVILVSLIQFVGLERKRLSRH